MSETRSRSPMDPNVPAGDNPDDVQDLELRKLRYEEAGYVPGEVGDRRLSLAAMRVHNRHIQSHLAQVDADEESGEGPVDKRGNPVKRTLKCGCLGKGLESVTTAPEKEGRAADGVGKSPGADQAEDTAFARGYRAGQGKDEVLWTG